MKLWSLLVIPFAVIVVSMLKLIYFHKFLSLLCITALLKVCKCGCMSFSFLEKFLFIWKGKKGFRCMSVQLGETQL